MNSSIEALSQQQRNRIRLAYEGPPPYEKLKGDPIIRIWTHYE